VDLLIDDTRDIVCDAVARNYDVAIKLLESFKWDLAYLDHDIGDKKIPERTGHTILCWLEEHKEHLPDSIIIVSANPVGRKRMQHVMKKLYHRKNIVY